MKTNVNEVLVSYLKKQCGDKDSTIKHLEENTLIFPIAYLFGIDIEKQFSYKINKFRYDYIVKRYVEIQELFSEANINTILIKGIALANRLYDKPQKRSVGDVDIFVDEMDFSTALTLLIRAGYDFCDKKTFYNEHHVALIRENVLVELHKSIYNPILTVNEKYLLKHITPFSFSEHTIQTFDITATLLHLIYHLYQDTYWSHYSLHSVLTSEKIPTTRRFLYRAYEIALFSEKYYNEIKWDHIIDDLKQQKLRVFFKKMICDIVAIFPNAFPNSYIQVVDHIAYIDDEHDVWCRRLIESTCSQEDLKFILSSFIDDYWEKHSLQNIHIKAGESFTLNKPYIKDEEDDNYKLTCQVSTERTNEDLRLTFKVTNTNLCLTAADNYDTAASDGIHLMLFGTEKYSYNSIYIFPKIINGEAKAIPVDVKHSERSVMDTSLVDTTCEYAEGYYTVMLILKNKFLQDNKLSRYLYMGLIVVDCSIETNKRKAELVLPNDYNEWYNPTYFAKINIESNEMTD